jgi:hypothetical protein
MKLRERLWYSQGDTTGFDMSKDRIYSVAEFKSKLVRDFAPDSNTMISTYTVKEGDIILENAPEMAYVRSISPEEKSKLVYGHTPVLDEDFMFAGRLPSPEGREIREVNILTLETLLAGVPRTRGKEFIVLPRPMYKVDGCYIGICC